MQAPRVSRAASPPLHKTPRGRGWVASRTPRGDGEWREPDAVLAPALTRGAVSSRRHRRREGGRSPGPWRGPRPRPSPGASPAGTFPQPLLLPASVSRLENGVAGRLRPVVLLKLPRLPKAHGVQQRRREPWSCRPGRRLSPACSAARGHEGAAEPRRAPAEPQRAGSASAASSDRPAPLQPEGGLRMAVAPPALAAP